MGEAAAASGGEQWEADMEVEADADATEVDDFDDVL
jgi:hypothetical protein